MLLFECYVTCKNDQGLVYLTRLQCKCTLGCQTINSIPRSGLDALELVIQSSYTCSTTSHLQPTHITYNI